MNPAESEWTKQYWELIARHEVLLLKRKEGVFDKQEWNRLIEDMDEHKMIALANDIRRDMQKETL
jgi:hypothetical protein